MLKLYLWLPSCLIFHCMLLLGWNGRFQQDVTHFRNILLRKWFASIHAGRSLKQVWGCLAKLHSTSQAESLVVQIPIQGTPFCKLADGNSKCSKQDFFCWAADAFRNNLQSLVFSSSGDRVLFDGRLGSCSCLFDGQHFMNEITVQKTWPDKLLFWWCIPLRKLACAASATG